MILLVMAAGTTDKGLTAPHGLMTTAVISGRVPCVGIPASSMAEVPGARHQNASIVI